jgi:tetratricopeptide (TPR) repeat protein
MQFRLALLLCLAVCCPAANSGTARYTGPDVCALCHKDIAATQTKTAMATTWQSPATSWLPSAFHAQVKEGPDPAFLSEIRRFSDRFEYSTVLGSQPKVTMPIEAMVGGKRHSIGFLSRINQLDGVPLQRAALIQARYAWSLTENKLVLAPGCPVEKPRSYQTAFGIVLSPVYEERCLTCHGKPNTLGAGKEGGVHCESCHGPGWQHLQAVNRGNARSGIINPEKLTTEQSIEVCAQCHVGLTKFSDPTPDDLLIANQVVALKSSECFVQSGKAITCTTCHDQHKDGGETDERSVKACLGCHSTAARQHAAICPVNSANSCLGCHMPAAEVGPFHLVDHQIRVHPETSATVHNHDETLQSQVPPKQEFLRIIIAKSQENAEKAKQRLAHGEPFSRVALDLSSATTLTGGYMGPKQLADLDGALAATAIKLKYGETSDIIHDGDHWAILQRMSRDFKQQADQLQQQAESFFRNGNPAASIEKTQQALMAYPHFLRALIFLARVLDGAGNSQRAAAVLRVTTAVYPTDAEAALELGRILNKLGLDTEAIEQYRRAVTFEPDLVSAYNYLGTTLYKSHHLQGAIDVFRQGLNIDPLSANLYDGLSLALRQQGDVPGAQRAIALATKINGGLPPVNTANSTSVMPGVSK